MAAYYEAGSHEATRVSTGFSRREYARHQPERDAQPVRASAMLRGLPSPDLLTAVAVCATGQAI